MIKFVQPARQKVMLKLNVDGKDLWLFCTQAVLDFAKSNLKEGDEVEFTEENQNSQRTITKIMKKGSAPAPSSGTPAPSGSEQTPPPASGSGSSKPSYNSSDYQKPKTPEETELIVRQSVMASACQAITTCTGHIEYNTLTENVLELYRKLLAEVKKK